MSNWITLPNEVLLRIIWYCNPTPHCLGSVSLVCITWRIAAIRIAFRGIYCDDQNLIKLKEMVEIEIAGHSARELYIALDDKGELKNTILHFAIYCPNLTAIHCSPPLRRLTWIHLAQLSTRYFKNLTELPGPEEKEQTDEYNVCALMYRDRIIRHHIIGYHPSSSHGKFQLLQLQDFLKIKCLFINADKSSARLFDFDKLIDSCPQMFCLITKINGHPQLDTWEFQDYNKALYKPNYHVNILYIEIVFDEFAFDYIFHKFPNLRYGSISISNTRGRESYFMVHLDTIKKLMLYTSITLTISVPYETLIEMIKQTAINTLKLNFATLNPQPEHVRYFDLTIQKKAFGVKEIGNISRSDLVGILRASAMSTCTLRIQESEREDAANPMTTIVDILANMYNLVNLEYTSVLYGTISGIEEEGARNARTIFMPTNPLIFKPNNSLKLLFIYSDRIDEGVYPFFSLYCPKLCQLRVRLENVTGLNIYRIRMSNIHFGLFEFGSEHTNDCLLKIKIGYCQQLRYIVTKQNGFQQIEKGKRVRHPVELTIILMCRGIDRMSLHIGCNLIENHPVVFK